MHLVGYLIEICGQTIKFANLIVRPRETCTIQHKHPTFSCTIQHKHPTFSCTIQHKHPTFSFWHTPPPPPHNQLNVTVCLLPSCVEFRCPRFESRCLFWSLPRIFSIFLGTVNPKMRLACTCMPPHSYQPTALFTIMSRPTLHTRMLFITHTDTKCFQLC